MAANISRRLFSSLSVDDLERIRLRLRNFGSGEVVFDSTPDNFLSLRISNPGKKNALSGKMMVQLLEVVERIEHNYEKFANKTVLLLRGENYTIDGFCSGADISLLKDEFTLQDGYDMCLFMQHTLSKLRHLDIISIAAIDKFAVGGGTELSLACDLRAIQTNAIFQMVQPRMGLVPGWGGAKHLLETVSRADAIQILCSSPKLTASSALGFKVVDKIYADDAELLAFINKFTLPYPDAVKACKKCISGNSLRIESQVFQKMWKGSSNIAALAKATSKVVN